MSTGRTPLVSSFATAFKKVITPPTDVDEIKQGHRETIYTLIEDYKTRVAEGKAEGIRNARELVELIKTDLLLVGEVTDRTEQNNPVDDAKITRISSVINEDSPEIQAIMRNLFAELNNTNDELDYAKADSDVQFDIDADLSTSPKSLEFEEGTGDVIQVEDTEEEQEHE